ncbi:hypothetical protein ES703_108404 [subsurface metagenome]
MNERETIAINLKRYRLFKGLSQKELAKRIGVTSDTLSKLETGRQENPGLKYLRSICRELDISIEELFMVNPQTLKLEIVASDKNIEMVRAFIQAFRNLNLVK